MLHSPPESDEAVGSANEPGMQLLKLNNGHGVNLAANPKKSSAHFPPNSRTVLVPRKFCGRCLETLSMEFFNTTELVNRLSVTIAICNRFSLEESAQQFQMEGQS